MRVLVTRPQPQASVTAEKLRYMRHDPVIAPLTEIAPLPVQVPTKAEFIALSSANALRFVDSAALRPLLDARVFAVGARTAAIAAERGFTHVTSADGDVEALVELVLARTKKGHTVLYLCGRPRRPDFEEAMNGSGRQLVVAETYEAAPLTPKVSELGRVDAVLLYSQASANIFAAISSQIPRTALICMSARVAAAVAGLGQVVVVAERPTEDAMLAAINRL